MTPQVLDHETPSIHGRRMRLPLGEPVAISQHVTMTPFIDRNADTGRHYLRIVVTRPDHAFDSGPHVLGDTFQICGRRAVAHLLTHLDEQQKPAAVELEIL